MGTLKDVLDKHSVDVDVRAVFAAYRAGDEVEALRRLGELDDSQLVEIVSLTDAARVRKFGSSCWTGIGQTK